MKKHGIEWKKLGTHNEHLSVLDYKKKKRVEEIEVLEKSISDTKEKIAKENDISVALLRKARNEYAIATRAKEDIEKAQKDARKIQEQAEFRARVARLNSNMIHQISMLNDEMNRKERLRSEVEFSKMKSDFEAMVERFKDFVKVEVPKIKDNQARNTRIDEIERELFSFNKESEDFGAYIKRITQKDKQKQKDRSL